MMDVSEMNHLRPFKVGDFVTAGGVTGTVKEIGLFVTAIDTPDNIHTFVGNAKIFGDTIQNKAIVEEFTGAGYAVPAENRVIRQP